MATFSSTALQAKSNLVAALQAMTGVGGLLAQVQVTYGWGGRDLEREWVFLGDIAWSDESWGPLGDLQRQEDYTIHLVINVADPGFTDSDAESRAFALLAVIEAYLRTNPFQPLGKHCQQDIVPVSCRTGNRTEGAECQLEAKIRIMARI